MKRSHIIGLAATILALPVLAVEPQPGALLGTQAADIARALAESGYEMTKYEHEGNRIEVYALGRDLDAEVYVDAATGRVLESEQYDSRGGRSDLSADHWAIRTALEAQGYHIVKFERKRQGAEVYAERDGRLWELTVDPATGDVLRAEAED